MSYMNPLSKDVGKVNFVSNKKPISQVRLLINTNF